MFAVGGILFLCAVIHMKKFLLDVSKDQTPKIENKHRDKLKPKISHPKPDLKNTFLSGRKIKRAPMKPKVHTSKLTRILDTPVKARVDTPTTKPARVRVDCIDDLELHPEQGI